MNSHVHCADYGRMLPPISSSNASRLFEAPTEGMRRGIRQATEAGQRIAEGEVTPENMVDLLEAKFAVKANSKVIRAADEMLGAFLDELA